MELSEDIRNLLEAMDAFTGHGLRKRNDFGALFELAASGGAADTMEKLIFESAVLWRLSSKIKKSDGNQEALYLLKKEFESSSARLTSLLRELLEQAPQQIKLRFEETYYAGNRGSLLNLIDLAHDFSGFKDLQRQMRSDREQHGDE